MSTLLQAARNNLNLKKRPMDKLPIQYSDTEHVVIKTKTSRLVKAARDSLGFVRGIDDYVNIPQYNLNKYLDYICIGLGVDMVEIDDKPMPDDFRIAFDNVKAKTSIALDTLINDAISNITKLINMQKTRLQERKQYIVKATENVPEVDRILNVEDGHYFAMANSLGLRGGNELWCNVLKIKRGPMINVDLNIDVSLINFTDLLLLESEAINQYVTRNLKMISGFKEGQINGADVSEKINEKLANLISDKSIVRSNSFNMKSLTLFGESNVQLPINKNIKIINERNAISTISKETYAGLCGQLEINNEKSIGILTETLTALKNLETEILNDPKTDITLKLKYLELLNTFSADFNVDSIKVLTD